MRLFNLAWLAICSTIFLVACGDDGTSAQSETVTDPRDGQTNMTDPRDGQTYMTDNRDGQTYRVVTIGSQTWMAENLNYETSATYCYDDNAANCTKYGRLYTWTVATSVCPSGWHLPSRAEWSILFRAVGGDSIASMVLKSQVGWDNSGNGTDAFGFSAIPAGERDNFGEEYVGEGLNANFWSSVEDGYGDAWFVNLNYDNDDADGYLIDTALWFSVRCLQDEAPRNIVTSTLKDLRDGQTYKTVVIGSQTWMAENLNYETEDSYCFRDSVSNCAEFGRLYTWTAATSACPSGWHLPSEGEWGTLLTTVGLYESGYFLKSTSGWRGGGNGVDAFGFSVLPAGYYKGENFLVSEESDARFWSSTEFDSDNAYHMGTSYSGDGAGVRSQDKRFGFSVRCLRD